MQIVMQPVSQGWGEPVSAGLSRSGLAFGTPHSSSPTGTVMCVCTWPSAGPDDNLPFANGLLAVVGQDGGLIALVEPDAEVGAVPDQAGQDHADGERQSDVEHRVVVCRMQHFVLLPLRTHFSIVYA